jgi:hypothetical protein
VNLLARLGRRLFGRRTNEEMTVTENVVYPATILERGANGSVLAHMLLAIAAGEVSLELTSGGQDEVVDLTPETLASMVANFGKAGPVPVYVSHVDPEAREFLPASGWVEAVAVEGERGELLVGDVRLGPGTSWEVVDAEGWRSCSIEFGENVETPTGVIEGWSLLGLALTNTPALPIENRFQFGAPRRAKRLAHASVRFGQGATKENTVEENVEPKDAPTESALSVETVADPAAQLDAKLAELTADFDRRKAELEAKIAELSGKIEAEVAAKAELAKQAEASEIKLAAEKALSEGKLAPAELEGLEADPGSWMKAIAGEDADVAKLSARLAARKPLVNLGRTVGTGAATAEPADPIAEKLTSMGLDPKLANCRSASEARRALNSKE